MTDPNSGEGWYEWIADGAVTTHVAYVHENGEVYDPERGWNPPEFVLAAASRRVFRLVRMSEYVVKDRNGSIVYGPDAPENAMRYAAALNRDYQTDDYRIARWEGTEP